MAIIEGIVVGLGIHLGKRLLDRLWVASVEGQAPVATQSGQLGLTASHAGRTLVQPTFAARPVQAPQLVVGELYLQQTLTDILFGDEIPLVLVIEETRQDTLLFKADLDMGYEIYLPPGIYSFYAFLMDPDADDLFDAQIYAVGLPSAIDLQDLSEFELEDPDDVWSIVSDSPVEVGTYGPYSLNLILIDTDYAPELPQSFSELIGDSDDQTFDLTGTWQLEEEYEFGGTVADAYLLQVGTTLHGMILIRDSMDDGSELICQETVEGVVQGRNVYLDGTGVRVIKGRTPEYNLDRWAGIVENRNTIAGISEDAAGVQGEFIMTRSLAP